MSDPHRGLEWGLVSLQALLGLGLLAATRTGAQPLVPRADSGVSLALDALAALAILGALAIGGSALVSMRGSFRVRPTPRPGARLVRHGIYRYLRHPMYSAVLAVCAAITLHQRTVPVLVLALANAALYLCKARYEEGRLRAHYRDYDEYRARTWGVVPGRGRAKS